MSKRISALKDEDGGDVEVKYSVTLSFVVGAVAPCGARELAGLVNDRVKAAGGVWVDDIDSFEITAVERM